MVTAASNWTSFYEAMADALLQYRYDRSPLVEAIADIDRRRELPFAITDQFSDRSTGPLRDICPFTAMGTFNRNLTNANRIAIATELAQFLDVMEQVPNLSTDENGIPLLNNQNSWFFAYAYQRQDHHIDTLWQVFADAIAVADGEDPLEFVQSYDNAQLQPFVRWNLTIGLYWMRPWQYPPLDSNCRNYITNRLRISLPGSVPSGANYLRLRDLLKERFQDDECLTHSFPQMSWAAYHPNQIPPKDTQTRPIPGRAHEPPSTLPAPPHTPTYTIANILADGCFLPQSTLETMLNRLRTKQNIILQGPPGAGKTWLSKRLAYALIGHKDDDKVRQV